MSDLDKQQVDDAPKTSKDDENISKNEPQYIDEAKLNSAITGRLKSFEKRFDEKLDKLIASQNSSKKEDATKEDVSEFKLLQRKIQELESEREAEKQASRSEKLNSTVKDQLLNIGVEPKVIRSVIALFKEDKAIGYNADGEIVFKDRFSGEMDLAAGLKKWQQSEEAKFFIPAKTIKGAGATSPKSDNKTPSSKNKLTDDQV